MVGDFHPEERSRIKELAGPVGQKPLLEPQLMVRPDCPSDLKHPSSVSP